MLENIIEEEEEEELNEINKKQQQIVEEEDEEEDMMQLNQIKAREKSFPQQNTDEKEPEQFKAYNSFKKKP